MKGLFDDGKLWGRRRKLASVLRYGYLPIAIAQQHSIEAGWWRPRRDALPDFLGLGAPQAGSTWLHRNLAAHPDLYLPREKEFHYFDRNYHKRIGSYAKCFAPAEGRLKGEITPGYSILDRRRIRFIQTIMPDIRLVYILRNPIEQRLSKARRDLSRIQENPLETLDEKFVFSFLKSATGRPGRYAPNVFRHNYAAILENWWSVFPREQLHIAYFEDISRRPIGMLGEIFEHIGASTQVDWEAFPAREVVNANPRPPVPAKYRDFLANLYWREIEAVYRLLGDPVADWRCGPQS